jgi:phosphohistidine phosphatase
MAWTRSEVTRRLVLLRHAEAARPPATADVERDLTEEGEEEAREAGRRLAGPGPHPDLVVVSPSVRTRRTWTLAAAAAPDTLAHVPMIVEPAVYRAEGEDLLGVVREFPDTARTVALVGHEPGLSELADLLLGQSAATTAGERLSRDLSRLARGLRTGADAVLEGEGGWRQVQPAGFRLSRVSRRGR